MDPSVLKAFKRYFVEWPIPRYLLSPTFTIGLPPLLLPVKDDSISLTSHSGLNPFFTLVIAFIFPLFKSTTFKIINGSMLYTKMSEFNPSVVEKDSISIILTGFKRDNLDQHIQSIKQQTIQSNFIKKK